MTYNDPFGVLTNETWIANFVNGSAWVEAGAYVGHSYAGSLQGQEIYFAGQLDSSGGWSQINWGPIPPGDINQWANVYIFNSASGQWSVVIESLTLGSLTTPPASNCQSGCWRINNMQAQYQQIGEEQGNDGFTSNPAQSDLAYWTNNKYRDNSGQYWVQTTPGLRTVNPPISADWISMPPDGSGGMWWARLP